MKLTTIYFWICVTICLADEDTQEQDSVPFPGNIQDFVRKLTQQQVQTTQNMQAALLPRLNLPLLHPHPMGGKSEEVESPLSLLNIPFRNNFGGESSARTYSATDGESSARSYASSQSGGSGSARSYSSAAVKRPLHEDGNLEAKSSAFASLKDVNEEEHLGEAIDEPSHKNPTVTVHHSTPPDKEASVSDGNETTRIGAPYSLKRLQDDTEVTKAEDNSFSDLYFVAIVAGCCAVGIFGVISAGICFYKLQKSRKAAADVDYPAYGVTGPNKDISSPNGDRKLAQSAQMYHYQHQKQQMIAVEKAGSTKNTSASDVDSEEENEEGDYTVYECPGLAPTGEMEVKNPLFHDDSTPVSPPVLSSKPDNQNH